MVRVCIVPPTPTLGLPGSRESTSMPSRAACSGARSVLSAPVSMRNLTASSRLSWVGNWSEAVTNGRLRRSGEK